VSDKVVVECSSLGYGWAGFEEGLIEEYAQSFGDAERTAGMFHLMGDVVRQKAMAG
jgi:hypothetical protein